MITLNTLRELFRYCDWADTKVLDAAATRDAAALDRKFEMGMGSLRRTLLHIHNGEHVWLQRWKRETPAWPSEDGPVDVAALRERFQRTWHERDAFVATLGDADLLREQKYRDSKGNVYLAALGDMLVQMCNHSHHHRAQALNMLRHTGADLPKPGLDYIFMRLANPSDPPPTYDLPGIRHLLIYGNRAQERIFDAVAALSDAQLDQPFEMGVGSIRKTLLHIRFAEQWWQQNWIDGPGKPFPELDEATPAADVRRLWQETISRRDSYVAALREAELNRIVEAHPRPDVVRKFPLGVTLLQTFHHGVHHRAQAVNMIRRVGGELVELDYMMSLRRPA
jgi:uncharacterized damage-inducible protein DinB